MLLFIGCFSTGGKSAVLGLLVITVVGVFLVALRNSGVLLLKVIIPMFFFLITIPLLQTWKPEIFAAFTERSNKKGGSAEDILERVIDPFSDLSRASVFGNGLGVMTNGSDKISSYAAGIRSGGYWTETDFGTILWEGGLYLMVTWYFFRLFLICYSLKILFSLKTNSYYNAAAFIVPFIIIQGIIGTLTIQPPIAIYFWLCFGALLCIKQFDSHKIKEVN